MFFVLFMVNFFHQDMLYWWIGKFTPLGMEVFIL